MAQLFYVALVLVERPAFAASQALRIREAITAGDHALRVRNEANITFWCCYISPYQFVATEQVAPSDRLRLPLSANVRPQNTIFSLHGYRQYQPVDKGVRG